MVHPVRLHAVNKYRQLISAANPGLILILVDQSLSMNQAFGPETRASEAAAAVNRVIYEIQQASQAGQRIRDRCYVGVVGYGATVKGLVGGMISQVASSAKEYRPVRRKVSDGDGGLTEIDWSMPVWVDPFAKNGTPMDEAFDLAHKLVSAWVKNHPDCFPPVVINITDGMPNDLQNGGDGSRTRAAARRLLGLHTSDGDVLLFNAHICDGQLGEIVLPTHVPEAADVYAQFLFDISSRIPDPLLDTARNVGFDTRAGARGFVFDARPETLVRLLTFGSKPMT